MLASPALAVQCPALWRQLDVEMRGALISMDYQLRVTELRRQATKLHHSGKHAEAQVALHAALALVNPAY
jgi:hypothetical protein